MSGQGATVSEPIRDELCSHGRDPDRCWTCLTAGAELHDFCQQTHPCCYEAAK